MTDPNRTDTQPDPSAMYFPLVNTGEPQNVQITQQLSSTFATTKPRKPGAIVTGVSFGDDGKTYYSIGPNGHTEEDWKAFMEVLRRMGADAPEEDDDE